MAGIILLVGKQYDGGWRAFSNDMAMSDMAGFLLTMAGIVFSFL